MVKKLQASRMLIAAVLVLAAGGTAAAAATSQTASHARSGSAVASTRHQAADDAKARAALMAYLSSNGKTPGAAPFSLASPGKTVASSAAKGSSSQAGITQAQNYQTSGYQDTATPGTFTAVRGTWRVPATVCTPEQQMNSTWVGFDGADFVSAEQLGTLAYCYEGKAHYFIWWDVYPIPTVQVSSTLRPGDLVTGSVTRNGTSYTLSLTDATDPAQSFTTTQNCATPCKATSAEWIAERPFLPQGVAPLAPFSWTLTNASQTSNGVTGGIDAGPSPTEITMMDVTMAYPLDAVSNLSRNGTSFRVHWLNSY